jgi:hypothetical protein
MAARLWLPPQLVALGLRLPLVAGERRTEAEAPAAAAVGSDGHGHIDEASCWQ